MATYSPERRAEAIGLAVTVGSSAAMARTGIPRRTIDRWLRDPATRAIVATSAEPLAERLKAAIDLGLAEVTKGLANPREGLHAKARALEVLHDAYRLASGQSTANVATRSVLADMPDDQRIALRDGLDDALARITLGELPADPLSLSKDEIANLIASIERALG